MNRILLDYLRKWQTSPIRTPLIVRGARQVGKTYLVREFGRESFKSFLEVNLETSPHLWECFRSLDAKTICQQLETVLNTEIIPGETLLFIDEIQASKQALLSLRSFKETLPNLHVIAAGSLLEFALQDKNAFSFPVGRVTFAHLQPVSFVEFLSSMNEPRLITAIKDASIAAPCPPAVHNRLLELTRTYFMLGGMPEVIETFKSTNSFTESRRVQNRLVTAFIADFSKYGRRYDHRKLQQLLNAVPKMVGKKFKFSHVDPSVTARDFKLPLLDLERSGLVRTIRATAANGIPLGGEERNGVFKASYLDIGLLINALGLDLLTTDAEQAVFINEGALAEQFVGQELLANLDPESSPQLYYWVRETKGAEAEVDFVTARGTNIIPIEVKAGARGRLKSLRQFMIDKKSPLGIRLSQLPLSLVDGILSIPLYMASEIPRLVAPILKP